MSLPSRASLLPNRKHPVRGGYNGVRDPAGPGPRVAPMTEQENRAHGADSEVGTLRTVMLHRPGTELKRLTPRNNDRLLFDGIPWVARAQDEHDAFAAALRDRDVEV